MSRWGRLSELVRVGCLFMMVGNGLVASLQYKDHSWKYLVYLFPANFGQGMSYPAILFTFLAAFDHSREYPLLWDFPQEPSLMEDRASRLHVHGLLVPLNGHSVGRRGVLDVAAKRSCQRTSTGSSRGS